MRKLYNEVETCVRNLRSLEVETKTYGCLLIPLLKDKLPEQMLLEISRGFGGAAWILEGFLKGLNNELQAKESVLGCTKGERRKDNKGSYTVDGFHVQGMEIESLL